jgi:hypothetical protein
VGIDRAGGGGEGGAGRAATGAGLGGGGATVFGADDRGGGGLLARGLGGGAGGGDITPLRATSGARRVTRTFAGRAPIPSKPDRGVLRTSIVTLSSWAPRRSSAWLIASSTEVAVTSIESAVELLISPFQEKPVGILYSE